MLDRCFNFVFSYPSSAVARILDELSPAPGAVILDPFCGTGTTLVECKRRGVRSIGIDANPVCVLAARVKTNWLVDTSKARRSLKQILLNARANYKKFERARSSAKRHGRYLHPLSWRAFEDSARGEYLRDSGLIRRRWISPTPALKSLLLAEEISRCSDPAIRNLLMVALLGLLVPQISNLKYGPELYPNKRRRDVQVFDIFAARVEEVLDSVVHHRRQFPVTRSRVVLGNSINGALSRVAANSVSHAVTSPPYPAEHDYTRMTRLELVFGGFVDKDQDLRRIKRRMIPSSSKSCYVDQPYYESVRRFARIRNLRASILDASKSRTHGFARVYPRLVGDYFGAMYEHLLRLKRCLRPGATCAYIVGDQSSFFGIHIETAALLRCLLESKRIGFEFIRADVLRRRRGSGGVARREIPEIILYFRKPGKGVRCLRSR